MIPTPEQILAWRAFTRVHEEAAAKDPDLKNKVVIVLRLKRNDPECQTAMWGPDWDKHMRFGNCSLCKEKVIVRPIFERSILVCTDCGPNFFKASKGEPQ